MDKEDLEEKMKDWFSKGAKASKKALETVGDKVQDFTDKSVVKLEKKQLNSKLDARYMELGKIVSALLFENGEEILTADTERKESIDTLQADIRSLQLQIIEKDKEIKQIGKTTEDK